METHLLPLLLLEQVLALTWHLRGLAALARGISCSVAPSWASGSMGIPPTSCDDPELVDSFACTGRTGSSRGLTHCRCLSCAAATRCCPTSSSKGTVLKCANLPIHSANASAMWECVARASSFGRPRYPCRS